MFIFKLSVDGKYQQVVSVKTQRLETQRFSFFKSFYEKNTVTTEKNPWVFLLHLYPGNVRTRVTNKEVLFWQGRSTRLRNSELLDTTTETTSFSKYVKFIVVIFHWAKLWEITAVWNVWVEYVTPEKLPHPILKCCPLYFLQKFIYLKMR